MTKGNLADAFRSNHLKATPQRIAIYGYLMETKEHPSVEEIYNALREAFPNMSLATVYKTVASLKSAGLVRELNAGEDSFRYDANTHPHAHTVCKKCHRVEDFEGQVISPTVRRSLEIETGFAAESEAVYFFGVCSECRKNINDIN